MDTKDIKEIKNFLEGENDDYNYIVNVEADKNTNVAKCIIHKPDGSKYIEPIQYTPFLFVKDFKLKDLKLYGGDNELIKSKMYQHGIKFTKLNTGNQKRLETGYCYKVTSWKSFNNIIQFYKDGGVNPYEKKKNEKGRVIKEKNGRPIFLYRDLFYYVSPEEQFFIDKKLRLFKGIDHYNDIHRLTFDIETQGLRPSINRVFSIGVKDNKGFETIVEAKKDDDESEREVIVDFFKIINKLKPAVICGYNSEDFDFNFILERAKILELDLSHIKTTISDDQKIKRKQSTVKIGGKSLKYVATIIWGTSVIDIQHAVKKTAAINSDIKEFGLKYICKFEEVAKPNRMYIDGDDAGIYNMWKENKMFLVDTKNNNYKVLPDIHQELGVNLYKLQNSKNKLSKDEYNKIRNKLLKEDNNDFVKWFKDVSNEGEYNKIVKGKNILRQYLLDDLWETEKIDELYNQSSFLLAKMIPTTYSRICTMGTASTWNLLLTAWSNDNNLAIPESDEKTKFSGGLSRCFKKGYNEDVIKIDFASLYPMIQLTYDVFPIFDITNIIKRMLLYMTTTRNVYKKMASGDNLNENELSILELNNYFDIIEKYKNNTLLDSERKMFKVQQLPIKTLNNSLFGALGSGYSFNWSDNICAGRITTIGRLELRKAIKWFENYGCKPLLCVTDGINFGIPKTTKYYINNKENKILDVELPVNEAWKYNDKTGISALIEKFNNEVMVKPYMAVDDDGQFISCLNLKKNNYALLEYDKKKDKKKVKLIGGMIKNKVMPEYIEDFIDKGLIMILEGRGEDFVEYYNSYCEDIFYQKIPLKKIASKKRVKESINEYINRGVDKNGKIKAKKAHMELIIEQRNEIVKDRFKDNFKEIMNMYGDKIRKKYPNCDKLEIDEFELNDLYDYAKDFMPNEPELDSTVYLINTGTKVSDGDSAIIKDPETGEEKMASSLIEKKYLEENPDVLGEYNVDKYLEAFNKKVVPLLEAFNSEIKDKILTKIKKKRYKDDFGVRRQKMELVQNIFQKEELILGDNDLNDLDEAITMEKEEIIFWNKYGYNPDKIWDGYNNNENIELRYDIYEDALTYLNSEMEKVGKKPLKHVDDKINKGDLILYKFKNKFSVGYFNGIYVKIIREDVEIPNIDTLYYLDIVNLEYEDEFRNKYNIDKDINIVELFDKQPKAKDAYDDLVLELTTDEEYDYYEDYDF